MLESNIQTLINSVAIVFAHGCYNDSLKYFIGSPCTINITRISGDVGMLNHMIVVAFLCLLHKLIELSVLQCNLH